MTFAPTSTVTLQPSGRQFDAPADTTLLQAALDAGLNLPYSCRAGHCGTCRGHIVEGDVLADAFMPGLTARQREAGHVLLCKTRAASLAVVIEIRESEIVLTPPKIIPCRVKSVEHRSDTVAVVKLRLPMTENVVFLPGQFIDVLFDDGQTRSYSIANPPKKRGIVECELHIRHRPGGRFTDPLFRAEMNGKMLRIRAPLGSFYLREESAKPIILLATGTGFAPIKSIVEHVQESGLVRPMTLYWGARSPTDFYMLDLVERWAAENREFEFVPVVSPTCTQDWAGRRGHVHHVAAHDFPDMSSHQVYACGSPAMVDAARRTFIAGCRLDGADFLSDAFVSTPILTTTS